ncbi:MAG: glycosyltransferase family 2 protein [Leadbetterella sp.]
MKISGFTFLKNAHKLYYPIQESILSILDWVDEYVIALGEGDPDDTSLSILQSINSPKIKIIHTKWDTEKYPNGSVYAQQTDLAKNACTGDWLFYLQGDEVIHEDDIEEIKNKCKEYQNDTRVEGFVFNYYHFWGDYQHYFRDHCWYKKEIRIVRNTPEIHSWRDAQSFRYIPDFQETDYFRKENTRKLNCILLKARVFHYGWVRPPDKMQSKSTMAIGVYSNTNIENSDQYYNYGNLDRCKIFKDTHPLVMHEKIKKLNWQHLLNTKKPLNRPLGKHERLKYRILMFIEEKILGGFLLGGFKNFKKLN